MQLWRGAFAANGFALFCIAAVFAGTSGEAWAFAWAFGTGFLPALVTAFLTYPLVWLSVRYFRSGFIAAGFAGLIGGLLIVCLFWFITLPFSDGKPVNWSQLPANISPILFLGLFSGLVGRWAMGNPNPSV
jgi:hypothetical protein